MRLIVQEGKINLLCFPPEGTATHNWNTMSAFDRKFCDHAMKKAETPVFAKPPSCFFFFKSFFKTLHQGCPSESTSVFMILMKVSFILRFIVLILRKIINTRVLYTICIVYLLASILENLLYTVRV